MRMIVIARSAAIVIMAVLLAGLTFLLSFNALGGALGGFDNEDFEAILSYVDLMEAGEQPLRDFNAPMRNAWPSLAFELPALADRLSTHSLLAYAVLSFGAIACCVVAVFLLSHRLARSSIVAVLAALLVAASLPRAYNFPKVLVLTVAAALLWSAERKMSAWKIAALAAWTVAAFLFRHDLAVYVAVATAILIVVSGWRRARSPRRHLIMYATVGIVLSVPSLIWVERYGGIERYVTESRATTATELGTRRMYDWPRIALAQPLSEDSLQAFQYYAYWTFPLCVLLIAPLRLTRWRRDTQDTLGFGVALAAMAALVDHYFLRTNLGARVGDASVLVALLGAWLCGQTTATRRGHAAAAVAVSAVFIAVIASFVITQSLDRQLTESGLTESPGAVRTRFNAVRAELAGLPPTTWPRAPKEGVMAVARYLHDCTAPGDRVLLATSGAEILYLGSRKLAGGQSSFEGGFLTSDLNQREALDRMSRQSVPVVLTGPTTDEFRDAYPAIAKHVSDNYRDAGVVLRDGRPAWHVLVAATRAPVAIDAVLGFPCFSTGQ